LRKFRWGCGFFSKGCFLTSSINLFADDFVAIVAKYTPSNGGLAEEFDRNSGAPASAVDLTWNYASLLTAAGARNGIVSASWGASGLQIPSVCNTAPDPISFTFNADATTQFGENIFVTGNLRELGNWDPNKAVPLNANSYPIWSASVNLPTSLTFQYKYLRIFNGQVTWESDPDRQATTPVSGSSVQNDSWR